jgi:hypothetical protein
MAFQDSDEKRESEMADVVFVEKVEQQPSIVGTSAEDAAMTRRILLKLDFRFDTSVFILLI